MATVNGVPGFSQLTKLNVTDTLLVDGEPIMPPSAISIERLVDGSSVAATQYPTGLGNDNRIQIEFGPALNTASDPVELLVDGTLKFNEAGTYRIKIALNYGRSGAAGTSLLGYRALVNGVQSGRSAASKLSSSNVNIPFTDEAWLNLPSGTLITYEVYRDSTGNDSGGLISGGLTGTGWAAAPSAAIRVERWV